MVGDWLVQGALLALGALVVLIVGRFLVAWADDDTDAREALDITGRWTAGVAGAAFAAGALGLVQFGDIVAMGAEFIGGHPYAVSNGITALLGWLALDGVLNVSGEQFAGLALAVVGIVLLLYEVEDDAA